MIEQGAHTDTTELRVSRGRLLATATHEVEIAPSTLRGGIMDVLESRGALATRLETAAGITVHVGVVRVLVENIPFLRVGRDENLKDYQLITGADQKCRLYEKFNFDPRGPIYDLLISHGNLAAARLYAILAEAHCHTPLRGIKID